MASSPFYQFGSLVTVTLAACLVAACARTDCDHGNKQTARMLADRPMMARYTTNHGGEKHVTKSDALWRWVAKEYGRKVNGSTVGWDSGELNKPDQYIADHTIPREGTKGLIRVRTAFRDEVGRFRKATFDEMWEACVFELINIRNAEGFEALYHRAIHGEIERAEWVRGNTQIEHQALLRLRSFSIEVWHPWAQESGYTARSLGWAHEVPGDYDEWVANFHESGANPYQYWGRYFDEVVVPYLEK